MTDARKSPTRNICLIGGPGTGKSTLAQELNVELKMRGHDSEFCPEFVRSYLRRTKSASQAISALEQFPITLEAIRREEEHQGHEFVVYDSASFVAPVYVMFYRPDFGHLTTSAREEMAKWEFHYEIISRMARQRLSRFSDIFFVPYRAFDADGDPARANANDTEPLSRAFESWLISNGVRFHRVVTEGLDARVREVIEVLGLEDRPRLDAAGTETASAGR